MFRNFFLIIIIGSIVGFIFGIYYIHLEVEPNTCRMTYMFGQPQFSRVKFSENSEFPTYGLFYYYEGAQQQDVQKIHLNGAPVIFIPGNGGSYKQARSLASVALRKAMHNDKHVHLDYFTIDYNEELSGLYGGYLEKQKHFLKYCIKAVLRLYNVQNLQVVLIGHSMGGKVTQALLTDLEIAKLINTVIFIATPLDKPVIAIDSQISAFYADTYKAMYERRTSTVPNNLTNVCGSAQKLPSVMQNERNAHSAILDNILLISTGGGNRDLIVRSGLTMSQFNDIHAMTSGIPRVGLSCDHLSAVWCLQFMLVINRFLFNISSVRDNKFVSFDVDKERNLQKALHFFVKMRQYQHRTNEITFEKFNSGYEQIWHVDRRRVFGRQFKNGLRNYYNELINIWQHNKHNKLFIHVRNIDDDKKWIFGCESLSTNNSKLICEKGTPLTHYVQQIPSQEKIGAFAVIDLNNIRKAYKNWTHILIRLPPTNKQISFYIDIYDPYERTFDIKMPRWMRLGSKKLVNETGQGSVHYKLRIKELFEPFPALRIKIEPLSCKRDSFHVTTKICVPWASGFERYQVVNETTKMFGVYINSPTMTPSGYNTSKNSIIFDIYLDPACRYQVSYEFSVADTMSRIVQQFYGWLPSHLIAVLFIVLKNEMCKFSKPRTVVNLRPYIVYFQHSSVYIITACRFLCKLLMRIKILPTAENFNYSVFLSIIIHSTAIAISIFAAFVVWMLLTFYGNIAHSILLRIIKVSNFTSSLLVLVMSKLPITFGVVTVAISIGSCSGIALLMASVFYFFLISNAYKDYLEELVLVKSANVAMSNSSAGSVSETNEQNQLKLCERQILDDEVRGNEHFDETEKNFKNEAQADRFGLQNFTFHITMFLFLVLLTALNAPATLAWVQNIHFRHIIILPDPSLYSTVIVLIGLSILLQLKAPNKIYCYRIMSLILYVCASFCVLYCQEAIFRLNYVVAFVFALFAFQEIINSILRFILPSNN